MKYIKINNFWDKFKQPDYKGLDITKNIPGSQVYTDTYAILATNQQLDISTLPIDVVELTEAEYNNEISNLNKSKGDPITNLQAQINQLGKDLALEKLNNIQKTNALNQMGQELAKSKLDIIKLQGGK